MAKRLTFILAVFLSFGLFLGAQPAKKADTSDAKEKESKYGEKTFTGLTLREIGPALTSGRIIDLGSIRATGGSGTSPRQEAGSGRRPTPAPASRRSSMTRRRSPSAA